MSRIIFINVPVADLGASKAFYEALGAINNPQFSDESAACMVFSKAIHVQLLTHGKWRQFTSREIPDANISAQMLLCISCDSRDAVDAMIAAGQANGGKADINPVQDHGFMLNRSLADPDGHIWEAMWMDASAMPQGN